MQLSKDEKIIQRLLQNKTSEERLEYIAKLDYYGKRWLKWHPQVFLLDQQIPPPTNWRYHWFRAGRGCGKTRTNITWLVSKLIAGAPEVAIIAPTHNDLKKEILPFLFSILPEEPKAKDLSAGIITYKKNQLIKLYSSEYEVRGMNACFASYDEIAKWCGGRNDDITATFRIASMGVRNQAVKNPQIFISSTPKPFDVFINFENEVLAGNPKYSMARMKTSEAKFLSPSAKEAFAQENTDRLARQELDADLLVDVPGALFESTWIERARITEDEFLNKLKSFEISLKKIVIGVDPAVTTKNTSDMTGIVVLGVAFDNHLYVLQDHTRRWTPHDWALKVRSLYLQYCKTCTTKIAIETNQGGDLVIANLTSLDGKLKSAIEPTWSVNDKRVRAQALAAKYQRGIVHHVGTIPLLERQMTTYVNDSNDSPDALDALVHAANYILFTPKAPKRDLSILEGL